MQTLQGQGHRWTLRGSLILLVAVPPTAKDFAVIRGHPQTPHSTGALNSTWHVVGIQEMVYNE